MPVNLKSAHANDLLPIAGVRLGVASAGVRKPNVFDVTVLALDEGCMVDAVFTQNRFCAAPVLLCQQRLASHTPVRALLINTGNANAGTGPEGLVRAQSCCQTLAKLLHLDPQAVWPFSTGVIMEPLPHERIEAALPQAIANLSETAWAQAASAIMTTDTVPKAYSVAIELAGRRVCVTGMAKGAGMIRPAMATMLGFVAFDACINPSLLQGLAKKLADSSFNRISIDGDTSTNDSFVLIATQQAGNPLITDWTSPEGQILWKALEQTCQFLAQAIVRDAEGATKFITIDVQGGRVEAECLQVAYAIAHSPLVKTAFFASDPNLGRILAAIGYAGILDLDTSLIDLYLDDVWVARQGARHTEYREEQGVRVMQKSEVTIRVHLGRGLAHARVWTSDLSDEYVKINANYRS